MLRDLRRYIADHKRVTIADLALRFDADQDALRGALGLLTRKGQIRELPRDPAVCGGCTKSDCTPPARYEWTGGAA